MGRDRVIVAILTVGVMNQASEFPKYFKETLGSLIFSPKLANSTLREPRGFLKFLNSPLKELVS